MNTEPVHRENTKTRRIAKDFFVSSWWDFFLVAALLLCVHRWLLFVRFTQAGRNPAFCIADRASAFFMNVSHTKPVR